MASPLAPSTLTLTTSAQPQPPGLQEATKNSTSAWQADLEGLFRGAKERFPDVVWELVSEEEGEGEGFGEEEEYGYGVGLGMGLGKMGGRASRMSATGTVAGTVSGKGQRDVEEVWGHKAIIYARAPPSFQNRYFSFRGQQPQPQDESTLSLRLLEPSESSTHLRLGNGNEPRTPSPSHTYHSHSQSHSNASPSTNPNTNLLRLTTSINPSLFADELEYLYTGKGFGEAFEFLFDSSDTRERTLGEGVSGGGGVHGAINGGRGGGSSGSLGLLGGVGSGGNDAESLRIDKLRKDLVFMWRSRLYSDVRIALTGNFGSGGHHENTTAIFSSHRFVLVSRSPYFYNALIGWPGTGTRTVSRNNHNNNDHNNNRNDNDEPPTLTLPSPPFTPASLHFTLGFIYTGTLIFSHRSYDLQTAFSILRSALYLSLPTLHDEIQARIVQEMMHGLFHAFLSFPAYEELTRGRWGGGGGGAGSGCRCRQCARRMPRILSFALEEDVRNGCLERGARRGLVGLFGEGWCTPEFAGLPAKIRESVLRGVRKRTTVENAFGLLWAAEGALERLGRVVDPWGEVVREAVGEGRKAVDELLARESERCFESDDWMDVMRRAGEADDMGGIVGALEDKERVGWVMASVLRGVKEKHAAVVYQTLVSSILLRPHPTDTSAPFLAVTSHVHVQVEHARVELLKWIAKRWLNIRQERGFDELEGWALKEISDHIEVPIDDLLSPPSYSSQKALSSTHTFSPSPSNPSSSRRNSANLLLRPTSQHPHTSKVDAESEAGGSIRVSVLSRSIAGRERERERGREREGARSVRSSVRTRTVSEVSGTSQSTVSGIPATSTSTGGGNGVGDSPAKRIVRAVREREREQEQEQDRPDSKLTPTPTVGGGDDDDMYVDGGDDQRVTEEEEEEDRERRAQNAEDDDHDRDHDHDEGEPETGSLASDVPSVYHTPRPRTRPTTLASDSASASASSSPDIRLTRTKTPTSPRSPLPPIQKTLITRASLASVKSTRSGVGVGVGAGASPRVRTGSNLNSPTTPTDGSKAKPRSLAPSIRTTPASGSSGTVAGAGTGSQSQRKGVLSAASTASASTSNYASAAEGGTSRPSSRGSAYSVVGNGRVGAGRLTTATATSTNKTNLKGTPSPTSRPVSRVSTLSSARSTSGGGGNRPTSGTSASTYRTAPDNTLNTPSLSTSTSTSQRTRKTSAASAMSVASTVSVRTAGAGAGAGMGRRSAAGSPVSTNARERARKVSTASVSSVASNVGGRTGTGTGARTRTTSARGNGVDKDKDKLSPSSATTRVGAGAKKAPGTTTTMPARTRTLSNKKSGESLSLSLSVVGKAKGKGSGSGVPPLPGQAESSREKGVDNDKEKMKDEMDQDQDQEQTSLTPKDGDEAAAAADESFVAPADESSSPMDEDGNGDERVVVPPSSSSSYVEDSSLSLSVEETDKFDDEMSSHPTGDGDGDGDTTVTNTASTMTVRQKVYGASVAGSVAEYPNPNANEHKKTSSSASSSSVATFTLRDRDGRRGSTETIRTLKSSVSGGNGAGSSSKSRPSSHPEQKEKEKELPTSPPLPPLPLVGSSPVLSMASSRGLDEALVPSLSPDNRVSALPQAQPQPQNALTSSSSSSLKRDLDLDLEMNPNTLAPSLELDRTPTGATLEIGIPCIISSKRRRFKAYARYIGEVVGEYGSWVGVEVPMPVAVPLTSSSGDGFPDERERMGMVVDQDDRQWNDGSWCGVRYFEIGGSLGGVGSEWGDDEDRDRAVTSPPTTVGGRKRRVDASVSAGSGYGYGYGYGSKGLLKREGDQLSISSDRMKRMRSVSPAVSDGSASGGYGGPMGMYVESRGLFVRPQQVLYVVDAVGVDF